MSEASISTKMKLNLQSTKARILLSVAITVFLLSLVLLVRLCIFKRKRHKANKNRQSFQSWIQSLEKNEHFKQYAACALQCLQAINNIDNDELRYCFVCD